MPRPTLSQILYGSATVIASAAAMLLLSQAGAAIALVAICVTALALGVLVALTAPVPRSRRAPALPAEEAVVVARPDGIAAPAADRRPVGAQSAPH
ncbi:hypothetical protein O7599_26310 [Streptomyces sp. WMMC500]|uniref:hypothetical protein n=1 Tax=Streptomyces sp. WMMC500 TaxID=3015154 RepID=UPI00248AE4EC|nr:hypothetical protein [Streptomyces sp. WMMC500]WBB59091.1 hypothetical protein O7599_26310 [Streptomyces sp. WMMC500]